MRRLLFIVVSGLLYSFTSIVNAQITINTTVGSNGYSGNTSLSTTPDNLFITFTVENNTGSTVLFTDVGTWTSTGHNGTTSTLFYSSTSLSGPPGNGLPAPAWTPVATAIVNGITTTGVNPVITGMNFPIPNGTIYRFGLHTTGTLLYSSGSPTPNTFTVSGITLGTGDFQIGGQDVGYAGAITAPRFFTGFATFNIPEYFPSVTGDGSYCSDTGDIVMRATAPVEISSTTGNYSFLWTGPNGFTSTDSILKFPKVAGSSGPSGLYHVVVLTFPPGGSIPDTFGMTTVSIYVQQTPNPPQVPYLISYCQGTVPDTIPVYGKDIKWYSVPEGGTPTTTQPIINTSLPGSFTYYVSQTVGSCESKRASVTVQVVPPAPPPTVKSPISYCQNDIPLPLEAVGQNLLWYSSDTALIGTPIVPTPSTGAQDTMTWYVTQTIDGCESSRVPIEVHINYRPNALVLASRDYVCAGDTLVISYYGNADGDLGVTFNWVFPSTATVLSGSGQGPYIVRFDKAGNQRITLIADNEGCASPQAHYDVEVRAIPEFTLNMQESACQGDLVNLAINQITPAIDVFVWDIAGGEKVYASETAGPYGVKWNTPGSKTITVVATDNACVSPAIQDEIFIRPLPDARITRFGDKVCAGDSIQLEGLYSPDYNYQWLPEQFFPESNSYRQWAKIDYAREITLNVTDIYNCKSTNSIFIQPENCCTVSFPTAFTPNEDTRNDVFRPITEGNQKITKFVVKNRWGQQVFESADDRRGWDGKLGGIPQDMGVYFYYIKYQCSDGKYYEDRGDVMLMR